MALTIVVMALATIGGAWVILPSPSPTLLPGPMTIAELRDRAENGSPDTMVIDALHAWLSQPMASPLRGFEKFSINRAGRSARATYFTNYGAPFPVLWSSHNDVFTDGVERSGRSMRPRTPSRPDIRLYGVFWRSGTHAYQLGFMAIGSNVAFLLVVGLGANYLLARVSSWRARRRCLVVCFAIIVPLLGAMSSASHTREHLVFDDHPSIASPTSRDWHVCSISLLDIERLPTSVGGDQQICRAILASLPRANSDEAFVQLNLSRINTNTDLTRSADLGIGWPLMWLGHTRFDADSFPSNRLHIEFDPTWHTVRQVSIFWPNREGAMHARLTEVYPGGIAFTFFCILAAFFGTKLLAWLICGRRYQKRTCASACLCCGYDLIDRVPSSTSK